MPSFRRLFQRRITCPQNRFHHHHRHPASSHHHHNPHHQHRKGNAVSSSCSSDIVDASQVLSPCECPIISTPCCSNELFNEKPLHGSLIIEVLPCDLDTSGDEETHDHHNQHYVTEVDVKIDTDCSNENETNRVADECVNVVHPPLTPTPDIQPPCTSHSIDTSQTTYFSFSSAQFSTDADEIKSEGEWNSHETSVSPTEVAQFYPGATIRRTSLNIDRRVYRRSRWMRQIRSFDEDCVVHDDILSKEDMPPVIHPTNLKISPSLPIDDETDGNDDSSDSHFQPRERYEDVLTRQVNSKGETDFCVRNLAYATFGRQEIELAEQDMIGLRNLKRRHIYGQPLTGARICGCSHITPQEAVFIETLIALGASVRWCASHIFSTHDDIAAALAEAGVPIFAWKGEIIDEFWWCLNMALGDSQTSDWTPNLILDNGGDLSAYIAQKRPDIIVSLRGIVEETKIGVRRLYQNLWDGTLIAPVINISNSVVKSLFDNTYLYREAIVDIVQQSTEQMISGKHIHVCGYGSIGKACVHSLSGLGAFLTVSEIDPICALQAVMDGHRVIKVEECLEIVSILITCTGTPKVVTRKMLDRVSNLCVLINMSSCNEEIDVESLKSSEITWMTVKSIDDNFSTLSSSKTSDRSVFHGIVDHIIWPNGKRVILVAEGQQANLYCSAIPTLVLSITATVQALALVELLKAPKTRYKHEIYVLPKKMDEYAARLHAEKINVSLTDLTDEQCAFTGLQKGGPFKSNTYRY